MAHNTSISLDEHFSDFLAREIASGRYRNSSEVVRAALRLLEDEETRIAADPDRGRACEEIRAGYRRYGIGSHVLFYLERSEGVDIVRILHQRMDPMRHL